MRKSIVSALAYFDLFNYPLTRREIFSFLQEPETFGKFDQALSLAVTEAAVYKIGEFYSIRNNYSLVEKRRKGNLKAESMMKRAEKAARVISFFPFVKGVAISGSLSKRFATEDSDIDFFIITCAERLWVARTILHAFKKITFLFRRQHDYCMNYFVDEAGLEIIEKNIYTATEVVTLIPLYGEDTFSAFYAANNWTRIFLPNNYLRVSSGAEIKKTWGSTLTEQMLNNSLGSCLDYFLMKWTDKRWNKRAFQNIPYTRAFVRALHTGRHFAKPHPEHFQKKLLFCYENSLSDIFKRSQPSEPAVNNSL